MLTLYATIDLGLRLIRSARLTKHPKRFVVKTFRAFYLCLWEGSNISFNDHHFLTGTTDRDAFPLLFIAFDLEIAFLTNKNALPFYRLGEHQGSALGTKHFLLACG
jgi:hypothetical protein